MILTYGGKDDDVMSQCNLMVLMRPPTEHDMAVHISAYISTMIFWRDEYIRRNHIISQQSDNDRKVSLCLKVLFPKVQLFSDNKRSRTSIKQCSATKLFICFIETLLHLIAGTSQLCRQGWSQKRPKPDVLHQ